jgi:hypothetical protein
MRSTAVRNWLGAVLALVLFSLSAPPAIAQAPNAAVVESWIDGLLGEIRTAGATRAERGAVTADGSGGFSVAGVTVTFPGNVQMSVARITGEGVGTGPRFRAQRLRIETYALTADGIRVEMPGVTVEQLDIPTLAPAAFFGRGDAGLVETLREFNVARWSVPTMTVRMDQGANGLDMTLRDMAIEGVERGTARRVAYGRTEIRIRSEGTPPLGGHFGAIMMENVDIALHAAIIAPPPGGSRELRQAYTRAVFEGGQFEAGDGVKINLGRMEAVNARLRTPRTGYLEFLRYAIEAQGQGRNPSQPDPEALRRMAGFMRDYVEISELERLSIGETSVETPQGNFSLGSLEGRDIGGARFGRLAVTDFEFESNDTSLSVGTLAITEVDYTETMTVMFDAMASGRPEPDPAALEGRLPRIGGIELRTLSIEAQGQEISLESAIFAMGRWRGFVPDLLRLTVAEFSVPSALIEAGGGVQSPTPSELGYESLDLSGDVQIRIDEQARTARLSPGRIAIDELGTVSLELTLGDVDTSRFGFAGLTDPMPLLQQTTFRELRLRIENTGIVDSVAEYLQTNGRGNAAQLRQQIQQGLTPLVELFIQDPAQKERARAAVQAFGRDPRSLTLVITPRGTLSLLDVIAATQGGGPPLQLLGQVNLELRSND